MCVGSAAAGATPGKSRVSCGPSKISRHRASRCLLPLKSGSFRGAAEHAVRGLGWPEMPAWGRVTVYTVKSGPLPGVGQDQGSSGPALGEKSSPVHGSSAWTEGPPRFVWRAEARRCQQPSEKAREARITRRLRCSARPENLVPCSSAVVTYWAILAPAASRQQWVHR